MRKITSCDSCGGSLKKMDENYIKCNYCGQIYTLVGNGDWGVLGADDIYQKAVVLQQKKDIKSNNIAADMFEGLGEYKDSNIRAKACLNNIERIEVEEEERRLADIREKEIAEQKRIDTTKKAKRFFVKAALLAFGVVVVVLIVTVGNRAHQSKQAEKYENAMAEYEEGNLENAMGLFRNLGNYEDAEERADSIEKTLDENQKTYREALTLYEVKEYGQALEKFIAIETYSDSKDYVARIYEELLSDASGYFEAGEYESAKACLQLIPEDNSEYHYTGMSLEKKIEQAETAAEAKRQEELLLSNYNQAVELYKTGDYIGARSMLGQLNGYKDSEEYLNLIGNFYYTEAKLYYNAGDYISCVESTKNADDESEWTNFQLAKDLAASAQNEYINKVNTEAKSILDAEGYDAMCSYLDSAVCDLYTQVGVDGLKKEYEPVSLASLEIFNGDKPKWNEGECADPFGNDYADVGNYLVLEYWQEHEYFVNGKYSQFSGVITPHKTMSENGSGYFRILVDDSVIYTSQKVERKTQPFTFSVNIQNANYIKIEMHNCTSSFSSNVELLLSDLYLYK